MWARDRLEAVRGRLRAVRDRLALLGERWPRSTAYIASVWQWMREEPVAAIGFSVALHVLIIALIIYYGGPGSTYNVKRGEPLFVELPEIKDEAPRGNPAARTPGPPAAPSPEPKPPAAAAPQPAAPRPQPPAPPAPRVAEARPAPPEPPRAAPPRPPEPARERPAPAPEPPAPRAPEPPTPDAKDAVPAPAPPKPAAVAAAPPAAAPPAAAPPAPAPPPRPSGGAPGPSGPQVAALPPAPREPVFDLRSLGRGGGAGGRGDGRGGIEGEPVPLDSPDPKYSDYLDRVRKAIKDKWGFPCADGDPNRYNCGRREGELIIEFGIAKEGHVPFITLRSSSGSANMDAFALNAIKLAQPFPRVPDVISKTGFPILARFRYVLTDSTLTNVLR
jgi:TonB family protein